MFLYRNMQKNYINHKVYNGQMFVIGKFEIDIKKAHELLLRHNVASQSRWILFFMTETYVFSIYPRDISSYIL